jgi:Tfp pilus assembly protein PilN
VIEVNLLPGGKKKRSRGGGGFSLSMPSFGGAGLFADKWILTAVGVTVVALSGIAFFWLSSAAAVEEMEVSLETAVRDSARLADVRVRTDSLRAQQTAINERVAVIQDIDVGRYVWPHILDEVAMALPAYTWISEIIWVSGGATDVQLRISGATGNNIALAAFMEQLEASAFLRNVSLLETLQEVDQATGQIVYAFQLEVAYEHPPLEFLETVPLFDSDVAAAPETPPDTVG